MESVQHFFGTEHGIRSQTNDCNQRARRCTNIVITTLGIGPDKTIMEHTQRKRYADQNKKQYKYEEV